MTTMSRSSSLKVKWIFMSEALANQPVERRSFTRLGSGIIRNARVLIRGKTVRFSVGAVYLVGYVM